MNRNRLSILLATLASLAPAAPAAAAADPVVVSDPAATDVTALDGTFVWVTPDNGLEVLMQQTAGGTPARVQGAPHAKIYRDIDLGHDTRGKLVLTYGRCKSFSSCKSIRDDLENHRTSLTGLVPKHCRLVGEPAIWGSRTASGADCNGLHNDGIYIRQHGSLKRLPMPKDALKYATTAAPGDVDIAGRRVGGVVAGIYTFSFVETTGGKMISSAMTADQEGEDDGRTVGYAITGSRTWALSEFAHAGDPNESEIQRITPVCHGYEALKNATEAEEGFKATGLAADGSKLYLLEPTIGIVQHTFAPNQC